MKKKNNYKSHNKLKQQNFIEKVKDEKQGWYNGKIKIKYTEASLVGDFKGSKLYGYIDPSFHTSQWQNALEKGFAKTAVGTNGVKFINNSLLELKMNCDTRLYTNEVHKNNAGDYIAIFDHIARHKEITRIANSYKDLATYEDCLSQAEHHHEVEQNLIGDTSLGLSDY